MTAPSARLRSSPSRARWCGRTPAPRSPWPPIIARRRSSRRSSRRWRRLAPSGRWPAGAAASASRSRARTRAPISPAASRSSGISSRRGPAAAPRRPVTAGPVPGSGRRRAGSSSAASKSPRCASRCSSAATNSAPIPAAPASTAAVPAGWSRWSSRPPSRRSATPPATACATAPAASSAAPTAFRIAIRSIRKDSRRARSRPRKSASSFDPGDVLVLESGGGGGWGDPTLRNPDAAARDIENGFVTALPVTLPLRGILPLPARRGRAGVRGQTRCTASASMSAAPLPISSRSTISAGRPWPRFRRPRPIRRSASSTGCNCWPRRWASSGRRCWPRPTASSMARRSRPTRCSNTGAPRSGC